MNTDSVVIVIGAGLAGVEAAWQLARRNIRVRLYEMRPYKKPPAHHTGGFAELVCSNSLRAMSLENAAGLLKEEMKHLNSIVMESAIKNQVPAGGALAVDRKKFSEYITHALENHPMIEVVREEVTEIPNDNIVIIATGPLTSDALAEKIQKITGREYLYFYDAAAPIVTAESLNMNVIFKSSRYDKGERAYLNCPMTEEEYDKFYHALVNAETVPLKKFEKKLHFEGCMPVEAMALRGKKTLTFGPLKPVGLIDPRTGKRPYAVVQLRQDNAEATLYNMVGFQTNLKWSEQKRVFRLIPGMERAEFVRYGVMHRNTYINSPTLLKPTLQLIKSPRILFAGQITGVEGYIESAASGIVAGINAAFLALNKQPVVFPKETAHGALINYITNANSKNFQPMNINFGILPSLDKKIKDRRLRNNKLSNRALTVLCDFINSKL
ncbi:MAG: FADH(2)-oxidizing methylenetetrahydrofolate--tRNA-(uracil(54)-C(5))-methyltransferase TrmFO [Desulfotomaculum sp.]|nr:FADH(2)-oxidizing methylenetetrahydrofolate--tRNA-(uracil(54)-C(5))-methyltransferase TrmFO [Desulfotomaculum sp.]